MTIRTSSACERCLRVLDPPRDAILPNYFTTNLHQIVQTPDAVMILTEMVHDARIVRHDAQHVPKNIRQWLEFVWVTGRRYASGRYNNFTDKTVFAGPRRICT